MSNEAWFEELESERKITILKRFISGETINFIPCGPIRKNEREKTIIIEDILRNYISELTEALRDVLDCRDDEVREHAEDVLTQLVSDNGHKLREIVRR